MRHMGFTLLGALALALGPAVQAQQADQQATPEANDYVTFAAAQRVDDRCALMTYAHRKLLNAMVFDSMLRLPGVAGTSPTQMGYQEYYDNLGQVVEPLSAIAETNAAKFDCVQAQSAFGQIRLALTADIFAHVAIAREDFMELADNERQQSYAQLLSSTQAALAQQPQGTLDRFVAARAQRTTRSGEDAANYALAALDWLAVSGRINATGFDLRWNGQAKGWALVNAATGGSQIGVFGEPARIRVYERQDGGAGHSYSQMEYAYVLPRRASGDDGAMRFAVYNASRSQPLENVEARIYAGSGEVSSVGFVPLVDVTTASAEVTAAQCDIRFGQCVTFDQTPSEMIRSRLESGDNNFGMQLVLVRENGTREGENAQEVRRKVRPQAPRPYLPNLREIFPEGEAD